METTTELTTVGVPTILDTLNAKIESLKEITESNYKTSGELPDFGNIKKEMKIENLIRAFSSIRSRELAYVEAAKDLEIKNWPAFEINGGNTELWKADIKLRIAIIEHKEALDKLTSYKERMSKFLSEADQKAILLKEMEEFLGK